MLAPIFNCQPPQSPQIVLQCAPYDRTVSYRRGAENGPAAIVRSLETQIERFERFTATVPVDECTIDLHDLRDLNRHPPNEMIERVQHTYGEHLDRHAFVLLLGGEHSVTVGALRAIAARRRAHEITVVQIDAHLDLREDDTDYSDAPHGIFAHATVMRRALDLTFKTVQVGVRAYAREELAFARENGLIYYEWKGETPPAPETIAESIPTRDVYLTVDVDGIDPAFMPATGTPVQGGLEWYYFLTLIQEIFKRRRVIGADVVEVAPRPEDVVTEYGAAQICYTIIALRALEERRAWDSQD